LVVLRNGAAPVPVEVARKKGYTVLKTGMSSLAFGQSINFTPPPPLPPVLRRVRRWSSMATEFDSVGGGVALKAGGETIGALASPGAPGGDKDNVCAERALPKWREL